MRSYRRGLSITETIVGVGIFSTIVALVMAAMVQSFKIWNRTASQTAAEETLFKAHNLIYKDFTNTAPDLFDTSVGPITIGGSVPDGDALWCLSFLNPTTGQPVYGDGTDAELGEPLWQRTVLYYTVVPDAHDAWAGQSCTGGPGTDGDASHEDQCPHKVLVRKVINDANDPEQLPASVSGFLDRPTGISTSGMMGEEVRIVGTDFLTFRAESESTGTSDPWVKITLRANAVDESRKTLPVGTVPLSKQPTTIERQFRVFPKNSPGDAEE